MTEKVKQHAAPVTGSDEIDIGRLVGTVIEARWWVIGITAVFALCAVVYSNKIGRAVQQECRDRSRMPSSA